LNEGFPHSEVANKQMGRQKPAKKRLFSRCSHADIPTYGHSCRRQDSSWAGKLAEMFEQKFGVTNRSECDSS